MWIPLFEGRCLFEEIRYFKLHCNSATGIIFRQIFSVLDVRGVLFLLTRT